VVSFQLFEFIFVLLVCLAVSHIVQTTPSAVAAVAAHELDMHASHEAVKKWSAIQQRKVSASKRSLRNSVACGQLELVVVDVDIIVIKVLTRILLAFLLSHLCHL